MTRTLAFTAGLFVGAALQRRHAVLQVADELAEVTNSGSQALDRRQELADLRDHIALVGADIRDLRISVSAVAHRVSPTSMVGSSEPRRGGVDEFAAASGETFANQMAVLRESIASLEQSVGRGLARVVGPGVGGDPR